MRSILCLTLFGTIAVSAVAQTKAAPPATDPKEVERARQEQVQRRQEAREQIVRAEASGPSVRLKDIARFRGVRTNTLTGIGLVMGLDGTGDSKKVAVTVQALANYLKSQGMDADPKTLDPKNVALVMVTAELPPFATNGQRMDVTVTSMGDAKSLRNGTLLFTELKAAGDAETVYATAGGPLSVGGFGFSAGGASQSRGFLTVGRIPAGGIVERGAPTNVVFNNQMFLELDEPDMTTAVRIQDRLREALPELGATAVNGGTLVLNLPPNLTAPMAMARIEEVTVTTDQAAVVVINERTGGIVIGGNVRLAPVAISIGGLSVKVEEDLFVSQPGPFSGGSTVVAKQPTLQVDDPRAQIGLIRPNATVAELAAIFQELKLKPNDIMNILQMLRQQGALKARIVMQ